VQLLPIVVKNINQTLYYYNQQADIKNPLGKVSAILSEYVIVKNKENIAEIVCKLYKTKEGYWYDPEEPHFEINNKTRLEIKSAIDAKESEAR
jgi:hypothetical protein